MKYEYNFFFILVLLFTLTADSEEVVKEDTSDPKLFVRVLLEEKKLANNSPQTSTWEFEGEGPLVVVDLENPGNKSICKTVRVTVHNDGLLVVDPKQTLFERARLLQIIPRDGYVRIGQTWYQGTVYICAQEDTAHLINSVDLENYIFSVIKSEGWPGWPTEVNKVFAITSRSYVIAKVMEAQHQGRLYHIKNTNIHQKYNGYHDSEDLRRAVNDTKDLFLAHDGQPILAMFDICCGGVIPAKKNGVNFNHAPYLARTYACTYCKNYKVYSWSSTYSLDELETVFKHQIPNLKKLKEVKITKKDNAGLVQEISLKAASGYHYLKGKKIYSALKKNKSLCFGIKKRNKNIIFEGKGYGHHMGLCQWGARRMVDEGWSCGRILQFFYPGTSFMRLTNSKEDTLPSQAYA